MQARAILRDAKIEVDSYYSRNPKELPNVLAPRFKVTGFKSAELKAEIARLIKKFPQLEKLIPEGTIFRYDNNNLAGDSAMAVTSGNEIFLKEIFLGHELKFAVNTSEEFTAKAPPETFSLDNLDPVYTHIADSYEKDGKISPELKKYIDNLPANERNRAIKVGVFAAFKRKINNDDDLRKSAILAHELKHIEQNQRDNSLVSQKLRDMRGNTGRIIGLLGYYDSFIGEIEQEGYLAGDAILKSQGASDMERQSMLSGYFVNLYRTENVNKCLPHAMQNSTPEFKNLLKELYPQQLATSPL